MSDDGIVEMLTRIFTDICASTVTEEAIFSREDLALQFTHLLTSTASKIVPKTQRKPRLPKVPWFTDKCKLAIKKEKKRNVLFLATHIGKHS